MSVLSVAVKHLVALGMTGDALVAAIAEMEAEIDTRSVGAKRQARYRQRNEASQSVTRDDDVTSPPPLIKAPTPQKLNPPLVHTHETRARGAAWPCPEAVDPNHWRDFLAARKRKNLVNTETARLGVLRDIEKHTDTDWPPGRLVEHAAAKGWGSINKPDGYQNGRATTNGMAGTRQPAGRTGDGFINAIRESRANREAMPWDADDPGRVPRLASLG